jgi:levanase/fructan beta-fructosidase
MDVSNCWQTSIEIFYDNEKQLWKYFFQINQCTFFSVSNANSEYTIENLIINQLNF